MYAKILITALALLLSAQTFAQTSSATAPAATKKEKTKKKKKAQPGATATETTPAATSTTQAVTPAPAKATEEKKVEPVAQQEMQAGILPYMKSHFSANYHGEFYFQRRLDAYFGDPADTGLDANVNSDLDFQDIKYMHNPSIIYRPIANWQILATGEFKHTDAPEGIAGTFVNDFFRALYTVTRKNIFTEKENGFQLDAGFGRRDFNTRVAPGSFGNTRAFATISKTFGKHNSNLFLQFLYNDPNKLSAKQWKYGLELVPTVTLQLTDKLSYMWNDDIVINKSYYTNNPRDFYVTHEMNLAFLNFQMTDKLNFYYQFKYYHTEDFTKKFQSKDDFFEHYAGVGYAITPKFTLTAEIGNEIIHAHDRRDFFGKKAQYPELALYLDAAL